LQWARKPYAATLNVEHERVTVFRKRTRRVQARDAQRNLGADASAAPTLVARFHNGNLQKYYANDKCQTTDSPLRQERK